MLLTEEIVKACCVLHNFIKAKDGVHFDDKLNVNTVNGFYEMYFETNILGSRIENDIRDQFADYFVSPEGELPWQYINI